MALKRTPLPRGSKPLKRTPMKKSAAMEPTAHAVNPPKRKRSERDEIPASVRAEVRRRSGGWCEVKAEGCTHKAAHMHHRLRKGRGGKHELANLVHACAWCHHVKIHGSPEWAYEHGWLIRGAS